MKLLFKTLLFSFAFIQIAQAGRYYNSDYGRFVSRDPIGYVDGMSLYNAYFAERFAVDPYGTKVEIIFADTVSDPNNPVNNNPTVNGLNDLAMQQTLTSFNLAMKSLREVREAVNNLTDAQFEEYKNSKTASVTWNGEKFTGTRNVYLSLIDHELESRATVLKTSNINVLGQALRTALARLDNPFTSGGYTIKDYGLLLLHGDPNGNQGDLGGSNVNHADVRQQLRNAGPLIYCSCYSVDISPVEGDQRLPFKASLDVKGGAHFTEFDSTTRNENNELVNCKRTLISAGVIETKVSAWSNPPNSQQVDADVTNRTRVNSN